MIIDQLPALVTAGDNDEIAIEVGTTTYKIKKSDFLKEFMPKSGGEFTGSVTVGGVLDVTNRRCYAKLSSAGWYRVMNVSFNSVSLAKFSIGTIVDIAIGTEYWANNNETHKISLYGIYNNPAFVGEESKSNNVLVDKVRYTYDSEGNGHIDVHYIGTSENPVWCAFTVHTPHIYQYLFVAENFTSVAPSPNNETVLGAEYAFAANTYYHDDSVTSGVRHIVDRRGDIVTVTIESSGAGINCPAGQYTTVYTLPSDISPAGSVYTTVDTYGGNNIIGGIIGTSGEIQIYPVLSSTSYYRFTLTYTI